MWKLYASVALYDRAQARLYMNGTYLINRWSMRSQAKWGPWWWVKKCKGVTQPLTVSDQMSQYQNLPLLIHIYSVTDVTKLLLVSGTSAGLYYHTSHPSTNCSFLCQMLYNFPSLFIVCRNCDDYDLCSSCEPAADSFHDNNHVFVKIKRPSSFVGKTVDGTHVPLVGHNVYEEFFTERSLQSNDERKSHDFECYSCNEWVKLYSVSYVICFEALSSHETELFPVYIRIKRV